MPGQDVKYDNRRYRFQKMVRETLTAIAFLLPNFVFFMVITFLPIFVTFFLSFTEWDGISSFVPKAESIKVSFKTSTNALSNITIAKGTKLQYRTMDNEYKDLTTTVKFVLQKDVVIPPNTTEYPLVDLGVLLFKDTPTTKDENGEPILAFDTNSVSADELVYMKEGKVFGPKDMNIVSYNLRYDDKSFVKGVGVAINMKYSGKEIIFTMVKQNNTLTVPKGTTFVAEVGIKKIVASRVNTWEFVLDKDVKILSNKTEISNPVELWATKGGRIDLTAGEKFEMVPGISNVTAFVKFLGDDTKKNALGEKGGTGVNGLQMVGLKNYKALMSDLRFREYFFNTMIFLLVIPIGMALSLVMALAMNQPLKGIVVFRVLYYLPVISNMVAIALLWRWILNSDYGLLNNILSAIGVANPPKWLSDKTWAKVGIIIVDVWKGAGYNMLLYLAGLQGIPHYLYEAAEIDGATGFQQFMTITWPLLGPTNFFIIITGLIGGFQAFGTQFVMMGGGPAGSTTTIVYYIYNNAYQWYRMGYATAIAVVLFLVIMIITIFNWLMSERQIDY